MNETDFDIDCDFISSTLSFLTIVLRKSNYNPIQKLNKAKNLIGNIPEILL